MMMMSGMTVWMILDDDPNHHPSHRHRHCDDDDEYDRN